MIRSMTGYGSASVQSERLRATVTVRSLNHRFLELTFHAPRRLLGLEAEVKQRVQSRVGRGRVDVALQAELLDPEPETLVTSRALVAQLVRTLRDLQVEHRLDGGVSVSDVLHFPGAIERAEPPPGLDPDRRKALLGLVDQALDAVEQMRGAEGKRLETALARALGLIEAAVVRVEGLTEEGKAGRREALLAKLREVRSELGLEEDRLLPEVLRAVERHDVTEEVTRLRSHVAMARELLADEDATGKRLDFLAQEMMREANTIGSKSAAASVAQETVALKAEIERLREQVQNVE